MMTIHKIIIGFSIMVLLAATVSAFEIDSGTYEAYNYHTGLIGGTGDSLDYEIRATTTFQQGSSPDAESTDYILNVGIYTPEEENVPEIILITPTDNSSYSVSNNVIFVYNVTDESSIDWCALYVLDILVLNDTSISKGENTFTRTLSNDNYNWSVQCSDEYGNINNSDTYDVFVDVSPGQSGGGGSTAKKAEEALDINKLVDEVIVTRAKEVSELNRRIFFFLIFTYIGWLLFAYKRDDKEEYNRRPRRRVYVR